jgi:hypothetical protein
MRRSLFVEQSTAITTPRAKVTVSGKHRNPVEIVAEIKFHATRSFDARAFGQDYFAIPEIISVFSLDVSEAPLVETVRRFAGAKPCNNKDAVVSCLSDGSCVSNINCV